MSLYISYFFQIDCFGLLAANGLQLCVLGIPIAIGSGARGVLYPFMGRAAYSIGGSLFILGFILIC
ncbi:MAG: hypothetical protein H6607_13280 [Flavobacteriales bacterium]|nr:hypothetical protein [Flavobacteriales bacterium]